MHAFYNLCPGPTPSSKHVLNFKLFICLSGNYSQLEKRFLWTSVWKMDEETKCVNSIFLKVVEKSTSKNKGHQFSFVPSVNILSSHPVVCPG